MGIDKFINDYLDGTITPEDDKKFRELLAQDPLAKDEFDLMISTHSLLKSDAESIRIPPEFQKRVEERILAQYLQISRVNYGRKNRKYVYAVISFLLLLIFSIYPIDDGKISANYSFFWSEIAKQQDFLISQVPMLEEQNTRSIQNVSKSPTSNYYSSLSISVQSRKRALSVSSLLQSHTIDESKFDNSLVSSSKIVTRSSFVTPSYISFLPEELLSRNNDVQVGTGNTIVYSINNLFTIQSYQGSIGFGGTSTIIPQNIGKGSLAYSEYPAKGMLLSGFSSLPLFKFGFADIKLKSYSAFSQSVGYKISNNFRMGLEFGYFDFIYEHPTMILVPATITDAKASKIYSRYHNGKKQEENLLTNGNDFSNPNYVQVIVPIDRKFQHYWGSLFFDYVYPLSEYLSVAGRVNVGATNSGAIGKIILFAEFQPIKGLAINLGVENKSYWIALPVLSSSFKSEFGLTYGISIKMDFE